jgi:hypothetical protein
VTVAALRTALAAIANAEAPAVPSGWMEPVVGEQHERPRLVLAESDVRAVVRREIADRHATISELAAGAPAQPEIAVLQAQADVLESYLR